MKLYCVTIALIIIENSNTIFFFSKKCKKKNAIEYLFKFRVIFLKQAKINEFVS